MVNCASESLGASVVFRIQGCDGDGRCGARKFSSRIMSLVPNGPIRMGPVCPASSKPTRRRISARMMRSPSSASCTSTSRKAARRHLRSPPPAPSAVASTSAGRSESCSSSPDKLPGPCSMIGWRSETAPPWRTSIVPFRTKARPARHLARLHDRLAVWKVAHLAEAAQAREVVIVQMQEHLLAAGFDDRGWRRRPWRQPYGRGARLERCIALNLSGTRALSPP